MLDFLRAGTLGPEMLFRDMSSSHVTPLCGTDVNAIWMKGRGKRYLQLDVNGYIKQVCCIRSRD